MYVNTLIFYAFILKRTLPAQHFIFIFNHYLNFQRTKQTAYNFYKSVFGGEFLNVMRCRDLPIKNSRQLSEQDSQKIIHISLPVNSFTVLMASDLHDQLGIQNNMPFYSRVCRHKF